MQVYTEHVARALARGSTKIGVHKLIAELTESQMSAASDADLQRENGNLLEGRRALNDCEILGALIGSLERIAEKL